MAAGEELGHISENVAGSGKGQTTYLIPVDKDGWIRRWRSPGPRRRGGAGGYRWKMQRTDEPGAGGDEAVAQELVRGEQQSRRHGEETRFSLGREAFSVDSLAVRRSAR